MKRNSRLYIFLIIKIIYVSYDILGKYQKTWKRKLNSFIIPPAKGNDIIISPFALSVLTPTHRHKLYFQNTAYIILYIQDSVFLLFNQLYFTTWQNYLYMEKEMATHSSIFAWKIPWTEVPYGLQSVGSQRVSTAEWLSIYKSLFGSPGINSLRCI